MEENNELTNSYFLSQNYPNPFNPITNISFTVKEVVELIFFDVFGNEIPSLVNEIKPIGVYSLSFDGRNLPSGVYIYSLKTKTFTASKKMILMKYFVYG